MTSAMFLKIRHLRVNKAVAHEVAFEIAYTIEQKAVMPSEAPQMRRKTTGVTGDTAAPINNVAAKFWCQER